jgi:hypothetical protein
MIVTLRSYVSYVSYVALDGGLDRQYSRSYFGPRRILGVVNPGQRAYRGGFMNFLRLKKSEISIDPPWRRGLFLAACLGIVVETVMSARADERGSTTGDAAPISFDIAAQPLETALDAYGFASSVQVLYTTSLTAGRRSAKIRGILTPEVALRVLLAGTGLSARYTTDDSYTLVPQQEALGAGTSAPDMSRYGAFLGVAQAGVLDALCRNQETRPGSYRVTIKFWLNAAGAIAKTTLLDSTGDATRDDAIINALSHASISKVPPADLPQPITMVIVARTPDVTGDCTTAAP